MSKAEPLNKEEILAKRDLLAYTSEYSDEDEAFIGGFDKAVGFMLERTSAPGSAHQCH